MSDKDNNDSNYFSINMSTKHKWRKTKTSGKYAAKKQKKRNIKLNQEKPLRLMKLHLLKKVDPEV